MSETLREVVERWEGYGHGVYNIHLEERLPCSACDLLTDLLALLAATAPTPDEVGLA